MSTTRKSVHEFYAVLELESGATISEIKEQWRTLSQLYHPDKHVPESRAYKIALRKQQEINEAYEFLCATHHAGLLPLKPQLDSLLEAANSGNTDAQFQLAMQFEKGNGRGQDRRAAESWYEQAAIQGHTKAQFNLAMLYFQNKVGAGRIDDVLHWWTAAADAGHTKAQFNLGLIYEKGRVVPKDERLALYWYSQAASSGDKEAAARIKILNNLSSGNTSADNKGKPKSGKWWNASGDSCQQPTEQNEKPNLEGGQEKNRWYHKFNDG